MAIRTNFFADGATTYGSSDFIAPWAAMLTDGVFGAADLVVSADSPADLAVLVAPGAAINRGYFIRSDAAISVPISVNTSGYNRYDLIVIDVDDTNNATTVKDIQGVPSSSPVAPAATAKQIPLALVLVGNNASVINLNVVADARKRTASKPALQQYYGSYVIGADYANFAGASTTLTWDGANEDPFGMYHGGTKVYIPVTGRWLATFTTQISATNCLAYSDFKVNGTMYGPSYNEFPSGSSYPSPQSVAELTLHAGDYIEVELYTSIQAYVSAPRMRFTLHCLGPA